MHNTSPERKRSSALILVYHSVSADADPRYAPFSVTPTTLRGHLDYLKEAGYDGVTIPELLDRSPAPDEKPVAITFDDGLADFYSGALPLLQGYGFPATLYVVSGQVGGTSQWLAAAGEGNRPMMTWAQIREAAGLGVVIGAHSLTHRELDTLPRSDAAHEISESRAILEDRLGMPVSTFAYPYGYHGPQVRQQVIDAGYDSAVAVKNKRSVPDGDRYGLARMTVLHGHSVADLAGWLRPGELPIDTGREAPQTRLWRVYRRMRRALRR